ncbi:MAG: PTS sugar transporter subunit IIB [Metamycoplasmataceae bacterium]
MLKILLACSAGMSTSLLEANIKKYAESIGEEVDVVAKASSEAKTLVSQYDIVLIGPQVRFMESTFREIAGGKPVVVIPPAIYAMAKGEETYNLVLDALKNNKL